MLDYNQRQVLKWFNINNYGAVLFDGSWICRDNIRRDADLARRFFLANVYDDRNS